MLWQAIILFIITFAKGTIEKKKKEFKFTASGK